MHVINEHIIRILSFFLFIIRKTNKITPVTQRIYEFCNKAILSKVLILTIIAKNKYFCSRMGNRRYILQILN